ncbi:fumarylacetoacetate hydrolase family protein [Trujillonella endophytica]|uniref:2-keto-4-pentenoate hydratase/2-oxohepta-3-ene-1,7-dioic acid hydratase (Catechol pathway) n=1 Tax=Trujillonella endophytica TaxID=673521 RepID=A0A1H8UEW8_9ACTN|nr:fumarylacetoacetate hydrolase family protein [Trujillella endophytica]SEP01646.1 2-keto-4-pentenoate hydratase/2-oxohepta-3-ene-1,7-dioic acid hydratase (catechol pathway) [Trujillella endophytica]
MDLLATPWGLGRREGDEVAVLDLPHRDVGALVADTGSLAAASTATVLRRVPVAEALATALPPLPAPGTVWGVGLNYRSKARATGREIPAEPILYVSAASSVAGPNGLLPHPSGVTDQLDAEAEIAVVLGRRLYRASEREAWAAVAGVTAGNDLTARDVMKATGTPALAKSFPGCTPLGASVLDARTLADAGSIGVRGSVNGVVHQDDSSADMIWSIPELLARISWYAALEPGDVFLSGTPAGTGQDRGRYLVPGDVVTVEVDGVAPLTTTVSSAATPVAPVARADALPAH